MAAELAPSRRMNVLVAILLFQLIVAGMIGASLEANDGHWVYPIDDAYTTLTLARNLAETGVMGINRSEFSATSSTPLYTVLLAAVFKWTQWRDLVPLVVNLMAACGVLGAASALLGRLGVGPWRSLVALLMLVIATPLPTIAVSGKEHTLQILASLLFVIAFLSRSRMLPIAAMLMTGLRYENIGLVLIALVILGKRRDWKTAARTLAGALVVPGAMALASWAHGWPLIPASILLTVSVKHPDPWIRLLDPAGLKAIRTLVSAPHLLALLTALAAGFRSRPAIAGAAIAAILIHAQFGAIGWLFRFEAYVVALGIIAVAALPGLRPAAAALVLLVPLGWRAQQSVVTAIGASTNIYDQQIQMARFFRDYYPERAVALNDIGAVSYLSRSSITDLYGQADRNVLALKRSGEVNPETIARVAGKDGVEVAAVFDSWFPKGLPRDWVRVRSWRVRENYILGSDRVTFYATSGQAARELDSKLTEFWPRLPFRVVVEQ